MLVISELHWGQELLEVLALSGEHFIFEVISLADPLCLLYFTYSVTRPNYLEAHMLPGTSAWTSGGRRKKELVTLRYNDLSIRLNLKMVHKIGFRFDILIKTLCFFTATCATKSMSSNALYLSTILPYFTVTSKPLPQLVCIEAAAGASGEGGGGVIFSHFALGTG